MNKEQEEWKDHFDNDGRCNNEDKTNSNADRWKKGEEKVIKEARVQLNGRPTHWWGVERRMLLPMETMEGRKRGKTQTHTLLSVSNSHSGLNIRTEHVFNCKHTSRVAQIDQRRWRQTEEHLLDEWTDEPVWAEHLAHALAVESNARCRRRVRQNDDQRGGESCRYFFQDIGGLWSEFNVHTRSRV